MKRLFKGYFRPTEDEFKKLWDECLFSFDANILLALYDSSTETRNKFFDILDKISDRIWLPHQVAFEYLSKRPNKILAKRVAIKKLTSALDKATAGILTAAECYEILMKTHSEIQQIDIVGPIKRLNDSITQEIEKMIKVELADDPILNEVSERFDNKVGNPYSAEESAKRFSLAEERCAKRIPPGFMDYEPSGENTFGDVLIWFQLIEKARETALPIVFTTKDMKQDWWLKDESNRNIGPRPELIQEMHDEVGLDFYLYSFPGFMSHAAETFQVAISEELMDEVEQIEEAAITTTRANLGSKAFIINPLYGEALQTEISRQYITLRNNEDIAAKLASAGVDLRRLALASTLGLKDFTSTIRAQSAAVAEAARMLKSPILHFPTAYETFRLAQDAINQAAADELVAKLGGTESLGEDEENFETQDSQSAEDQKRNDTEAD